ncbi:MAG: hypothetical protein KKD97_06385 [Gammaproteobacteria bacterium]|nr:hypothetical protein [Gammaproteobacteria bacterium]
MRDMAASRLFEVRWLLSFRSAAVAVCLAQLPLTGFGQSLVGARTSEGISAQYPMEPKSKSECASAHEKAMQFYRAEHRLGEAGILQRKQVEREQIAECSALTGRGNNAYWRCVEPYQDRAKELHAQISAHFAERDRIKREIDAADRTCEATVRNGEKAFADLEKAGKQVKELYEASGSPAGAVKGVATHAAQKALDATAAEVIEGAYVKRNDHQDPAVSRLYKDVEKTRSSDGSRNPVAKAVADESFRQLESQSHQTMGDLASATAQIDGFTANGASPPQRSAPDVGQGLPRRGGSAAAVAMKGAIDRSNDAQARSEFERVQRANDARDAEALSRASGSSPMGNLVAVGAAVVATQGNASLARQMLEMADVGKTAARTEPSIPASNSRSASIAAPSSSGCSSERAALQAHMSWATVPEDYMTVKPIYPAFQLREMIASIESSLAKLDSSASDVKRSLELKLQLCSAKTRLAERESRERIRAKGALATSKPCTAEVDRLSRIAGSARQDSITETARVAHSLAVKVIEAVRKCPQDPYLDQLALDLQQTASSARETCEMMASDRSVCTQPWPGL